MARILLATFLPSITDAANRKSSMRAPDRSTPVGSRIPDNGSRQRKKLSFNETRELESLPSRIEALEAEQSRLQSEAASPDFYKESPEHIRNVLARIESIAPELEAAIARWVELEERA